MMKGWLDLASYQVTLKGLVGFENYFNGIYFHYNFYLKTDVSRNGLSFGYSERDTSSVTLISIGTPVQ